jgi:peroxiredoxin
MRIVAGAATRPDADDRSHATISFAVRGTCRGDATGAPRARGRDDRPMRWLCVCTDRAAIVAPHRSISTREEAMPCVRSTASPPTELYYDDIGSGQPVVLIHAWPLSRRMWDSQVLALADGGYRCIAYDRRGFGDSGKPSGGYDYDTFASDLNDLMTQLDVRDAVLVGFSMGGGEVARYVARYGTGRVAKTALLASVTPFLLRTADNQGGVDGAVFDGMIEGVKTDRVAFLEQFLPNYFNYEPGIGLSDDLLPFNKSLAWSASALGMMQCINAFGTTDFREDLETLTVPTLIIHGDGDRIVPFEISSKLAHERIAGSRLEVIPGAPHGFAATHGKRLNELLLEFLGS